MGIVRQDPADNLVDYLDALEQVELAARLRGSDPEEAAALLEVVGLTDRAHDRPAELSGGEQQRVAFAAGAVGRPVLLLADEPTAELDGGSGARLIESMRELVRRGSTLVVASHDPAVMAAADDLVSLRDGRVVPT
jgi:ABC-type lipoprotein export system ATPase subunit